MRILLAALCFGAMSAAAEVSVLPGSDAQVTVAGVPFANPVRFQVRLADGSVAANAAFTMTVGTDPFALTRPTINGIPCLLDVSYICYGRSDSAGVVTLDPFTPFMADEYRVNMTALIEPSGPHLGGAGVILRATPSDVPLRLDVQNMWWSGPAETGWGMSVVKHEDRLFNVIFAYDTDGNPTWYVQSDGRWSVSAGGASFSGFLYSPRGAPWFAYDSSKFRVGSPVARSSVGFSDTLGADLDVMFSNPFARVFKRIQVQDFTGERPAPLQGVADMWWGGPAQDGWGVAILEQFGGLFAVWFTYGADGRPTWFVMPGGEWRDATTYAGTMYRTSGSRWVGVPYDPSRLRVGAVGPYTLKFLDTKNATLEINVDGVTRTLAITRQPF